MVGSKELVTPPTSPAPAYTATTQSEFSPLRRFMSYVKPYGLIILATLYGILKFILPSTLAVATRFVMDQLIPNLSVTNDHTDPSFQFTLDYLQWAAVRLPNRGTPIPHSVN